MSRSSEGQDGAGRLGRPAGLPKRWSARRKADTSHHYRPSSAVCTRETVTFAIPSFLPIDQK